jgi:decaprenylphospho-beta-D-ribofuranose 2-oxidase
MTEIAELHGWGRAGSSAARLRRPESTADIADWVRKAGKRGVIARGLGRSYGDAAQNAGGTALDLTSLNRILTINAESEPPSVVTQAGVSLDSLMRALLPCGLWVPVLPGTRQVTIGGAIAADVHGKNHHTQGSFGDHLEWLELITADGAEHRLTADGPDPDLFWATIGGMGLTGVITAAKLRLQRVESAYFTVDTDRAGDLDDLMQRMSSGDEGYTYSVAWIDTVTRGKHLGRSVITRGEKAKLSDLPPKLARNPLAWAAPSFGTIPPIFPAGLVNRATGKAFSLTWAFKSPKHRVGEIQNITQFFHPLDIVADWNRIYGPPGFLQYQFAVPFSAEETFTQCIREIANSGQISCLNVLKRFGSGNRSPLSFPTPGWTLAVDFPITDGLDRLCRRLDELVLSVGGRVYLAKDSRIDAASLRLMYPRLDDFLAVRRRVDPDGVFVSDLARRLELV